MDEIIGIQAVRAVLRDTPARARTLYLMKGRRDARYNELIGMAREAGVRYQTVEDAWFKRRSFEGAHQGVLLECHIRTLADEQELQRRWPEFGPAPLMLVLDSVTDPRNFGACLRTADAAGVDVVIVPKRNSAPLSAVALKTAQGGAENCLLCRSPTSLEHCPGCAIRACGCSALMHRAMRFGNRWTVPPRRLWSWAAKAQVCADSPAVCATNS